LIGRPILEELGRGEGGGQAARVLGHALVEESDQAEVGHLDAAADQQDVLGLDVAMLDADPFTTIEVVDMTVQVIDPLGRLGQVLDQFLGRDSGTALLPNPMKPIGQRAVGQLHADDEETFPLPRPEQGEQVRVADPLDRFQRPGLDAPLTAGQANKFQGDHDPARRLRLPDLAKPTLSEALEQSVAG